jgi:hypothetical protein
MFPLLLQVEIEGVLYWCVWGPIHSVTINITDSYVCTYTDMVRDGDMQYV